MLLMSLMQLVLDAADASDAAAATAEANSDDEMEMVWRTREVWDGAGGSDVLAHVQREREVELVNQAEEWERKA